TSSPNSPGRGTASAATPTATVTRPGTRRTASTGTREGIEMTKIAVAGKGGSGKTTIAGLLARIVAGRGRPVWAIDADTSPNLALTLGFSRERLGELKPMPRSILKEETDEAGKRRMVLGTPPAEVAARFGVPTPDGPTLLMMATVDHAGAG